VAPHHFVERERHSPADRTPAADSVQCQTRCYSWTYFSKVLMCDRISPVIQIFEFPLSGLAFRVMLINRIPEFDAQKPEI
jgi:hypothetical protein